MLDNNEIIMDNNEKLSQLEPKCSKM